MEEQIKSTSPIIVLKDVYQVLQGIAWTLPYTFSQFTLLSINSLKATMDYQLYKKILQQNIKIFYKSIDYLEDVIVINKLPIFYVVCQVNQQKKQKLTNMGIKVSKGGKSSTLLEYFELKQKRIILVMEDNFLSQLIYKTAHLLLNFNIPQSFIYQYIPSYPEFSFVLQVNFSNKSDSYFYVYFKMLLQEPNFIKKYKFSKLVLIIRIDIKTTGFALLSQQQRKQFFKLLQNICVKSKYIEEVMVYCINRPANIFQICLQMFFFLTSTQNHFFFLSIIYVISDILHNQSFNNCWNYQHCFQCLLPLIFHLIKQRFDNNNYQNFYKKLQIVLKVWQNQGIYQKKFIQGLKFTLSHHNGNCNRSHKKLDINHDIRDLCRENGIFYCQSLQECANTYNNFKQYLNGKYQNKQKIDKQFLCNLLLTFQNRSQLLYSLPTNQCKELIQQGQQIIDLLSLYQTQIGQQGATVDEYDRKMFKYLRYDEKRSYEQVQGEQLTEQQMIKQAAQKQ